MAAVLNKKLLKLYLKKGTYNSTDVIAFLKDLEYIFEEEGELEL
jgi:hypothetical protein